MPHFGSLVVSSMALLAGGGPAMDAEDASVISACIDAKIAVIEDGITGQLRKGTVFIVAPGPADGFMMQRPQLLEDLDEYLTDELERLADASRQRESGGWRVPPGIALADHAVLYQAPPAESSYIADTSFGFWAPGYSAGGERAVVRGLFTPSIAGASITCVLSKRGSGWSVQQSWLRFYR